MRWEVEEIHAWLNFENSRLSQLSFSIYNFRLIQRNWWCQSKHNSPWGGAHRPTALKNGLISTDLFSSCRSSDSPSGELMMNLKASNVSHQQVIKREHGTFRPTNIPVKSTCTCNGPCRRVKVHTEWEMEMFFFISFMWNTNTFLFDVAIFIK